MSALTIINAVLIGAFFFASMHHLVLWRLSRARLPLLIAIYCGFSALLTVSIVRIDQVSTIVAAQQALDARVVFGLLSLVTLVWLIAELTEVRPRRYLVGVTLALGSGVLLKVLGFPLSGYVTGITPVALPWGIQYQVLERAVVSFFPGLLLYAVALSVHGFAAVAGFRWSRRDPLAGRITMATGMVCIVTGILALLVDTQAIRAPYIGQVPNATWILLATILLSREHASRADRLEISEARLAVSEARYRTLIEAAPEAIVVFDVTAQRFANVNAGACRLFAAHEDELKVLNPIALSPPRQPDGRTSESAATEYLKQAAAGQTPVFEWMHRTMGGVEVPCEVTLVRLPDPSRILIRGSITDISDRRRLEELLRQSQKMEAIGQLAGGVAHDFNNLLTVISGYAEILLAKLAKGDPNATLVKAIGDATERAAWLTARLLAFGRRAVMTPQVFDLNALVNDGERILRRLIGEHIALRVDAAPVTLYVNLDPGQWSQVMLNLAINARDAMPAGGLLSIRTFSHVADAAFLAAHPGQAAGNYAAFSVTDTGFGMAPEIRTHIFEPFFTTKEVGKGTGLGLAVVHGIVTQAGGCIDVSTMPGTGTTFTVYLPIVDAAPAGTSVTAPGRDHGAGESVLVVEDETVLRELLEVALTAHGFKVSTASDGEEALRKVESLGSTLDLLVTDMVMPGRLNGRALADAVRLRSPRVKVLFISGYIDDPSIRDSGSGDAEPRLQKPFSLAAIAQKARETLDAK